MVRVSLSRDPKPQYGKLDSIWFGSYWCGAGKANGFSRTCPQTGGAHDAQGLIKKSVTNSPTNNAGDCLTQVELVWQTHQTTTRPKVHEHSAVGDPRPNQENRAGTLPPTNCGDHPTHVELVWETPQTTTRP